MSDQGNSMDHTTPNGSRWLWLSTLTTFAIFTLSSGKLLLALGMLLLGVFAFFNNPLSPTSSYVAKPSAVLVLSWACGFIGVIAVLAAAAKTWL